MAEIAAKQRYLELLRKVRNHQTLTARELKELRTFESMDKNKPTLADGDGDADPAAMTTQAEAAAYCGVSTRTMRAWEKEGVLRDSNGHYILERLDERNAERQIDGNPLKTRILTADAEHKEVRAELGRIQLKIRQGELVPRERIDAERIDRIMETRRVLLSLVRKLPPLVKGKSIAEMTPLIRGELFYTLNVFAGEPVAAADPVAELLELWRCLTPAQKKKARAQMAERKKKIVKCKL